MKKCFLFILITALFLGCEKDPVSDTYLVRTGMITRNDTAGVLFQARIVNYTNDTILDHGFIWSYKNEKPRGSGDYTKSLGSVINGKTFEYFITGDLLEPDTMINMRAYIKTNSYTSYGNTVSFEYLFDRKLYPKIFSIEPDPSQWDDTLTVYGKDFSIFPEKNILYYGGYHPGALTSSRTMLSFIRPRYGGASAETDFYIAVDGQESNHYSLQLKPPEISSVSPSVVLYHSLPLLYIYGPNLGYSVSPTTVEINNVSAYIYESKVKRLSVFVPYEVNPGPADIKVTFAGLTTELKEAFTIAHPRLVSCSPVSGTTGTSVNIYYNNIAHPNEIKIFFQSTEALILGSYSGFVKVIVPNLPPGDVDLILKYVNAIDTLDTKFTIL